MIMGWLTGTFGFFGLKSDKDTINIFWLNCLGAALSALSVPFYALIKTSTKGYRGAYAQIPCRVKVDPKLLNENEKLAYEAQNAKLRDDFSKAKFEIIRWGLNAKTENQYCPGQEIKVPKRKTVCLLLRYTMPGPAAIMANNYKYIRNQSYDIRPATGTVLCYASGYSKTSELYISIRPKKGELLKEIITIPCRIIPE